MKYLRENYGIPVYVIDYNTGETLRPVLKEGKLYWVNEKHIPKKDNDNWLNRVLNKL